MPDPTTVAGAEFLEALTSYLKKRLNQNAVEDSLLVDSYKKYLRFLGFKPDSDRFNELVDHMKKMKDAGRVIRQ